MSENRSAPIPFGLNAAFPSGEEIQCVQERLWRLLAKQVSLYAMGDSSVRTEIAEELLRSLCFTLHMYLWESKRPEKCLISDNIDELFAMGIKATEHQIILGRQLYRRACLSAPQIDNIAFCQTLRGMRLFFKRYDARFFAHQIPCDIDYPLCHPVPDDKAGIEYINEYLRRIIFENELLTRFEIDRVIRLLKSAVPDYKGLLINLYEPAAANALGLTLLEKDAMALDMNGRDRAELAGMFALMSEKKARESLSRAAERLSDFLGLRADAKAYLSRAAIGLYPRIRAALPDLERVFPPLVQGQ